MSQREGQGRARANMICRISKRPGKPQRSCVTQHKLNYRPRTFRFIRSGGILSLAALVLFAGRIGDISLPYLAVTYAIVGVAPNRLNSIRAASGFSDPASR